MRRLVLFAELYTTFEKERRIGLLVRNLIQYVRFMDRRELEELYIFTYGYRDGEALRELQDEGTLPRSFHVLSPPAWLDSKLGHIVYSLIGPIIHGAELRKADAYRTQQVTGSWSALIAKVLYRKPLLFRLGYPLSVRFQTERKKLNLALARTVERLLLRFADHVAVTSQIMKAYYGAMGNPANITVVPNFVDLALTKPIEIYDRTRPVLFVGRLEKVKNIHNIIAACARNNVTLHLYYGQGDLEAELRQLASDLGARIEFKGSVLNEELLRIHHDHSIFMLCSTREGMPKAMIEAMASGLICVATPTDGASELIFHGETGYMAKGYDADAISAALAQALDEIDPRIGHNAREFVINNLSLERAVDMELGILKRMIAKSRGANHSSGMPSMPTDPKGKQAMGPKHGQ